MSDELDDYLLKRQTEREATEEKEEVVEEVVEETTEEVIEETEETPAEEVEVEAENEIDIDALPASKRLAVASKLFGIEFKDEAEIEAYKERVNGLDSVNKKLEVIPKLVEKLKSSQNILSYFPDEKAYVAAQLAKQEDYKGKEAVISRILHSNVNELPSLEVIELAAKLEAPGQIRNPFRQKLLTSGLDPEAIAEGYDSLSEDDKDRVDYLAASARRSLSNLGADVQIPKDSEIDILAEIETETSRSKEDLATKRSGIAPIAKTLIESDLKEIVVNGWYKFKLELTAEDRQEYEDFVTDAVMSGEYDLATPKGKADLWEAVLDLAKINNDKKKDLAFEAAIREDERKKFREKSNNAQPIKKNEPAPAKQTSSTVSHQAQVAAGMISERE